jgi:hypothetical protein
MPAKDGRSLGSNEKPVEPYSQDLKGFDYAQPGG